MDFNDVEFLDEQFEQKVKNFEKFEIKIELIKGNRILYSDDKIKRYYLLFSSNHYDKEEFYDHLQSLKKILIDLLSKK